MRLFSIIIKSSGVKNMKTIEIDTKCGRIKGVEKENTTEWLGIKYATAKRWEYPQTVKKWDGVFDATYFKECAIQHRAFLDDAKVNAFYHNEFRKGLEFTYSEDCLFLNIYAPKNAKDCPVFIYIHGGSFTGGSSNEAHINGTNFAKNGVIFVSLNYRLNALAFAHIRTLQMMREYAATSAYTTRYLQLNG